MATLTARIALQYRLRQAQLSARLVRQISSTWRDLVDPARVDASWPALRAALAAMVMVSRAESTATASSFYLEARRTAGVADDGFRPRAPDPLDWAQLATTLDITGPITFKKAIAAGKTPAQAVDAAAVRLAGSTQYTALQGGRQLIQQAIEEDSGATGYARVTDEDPCAWCAMLASRGPVYKTAVTAGDPRRGGDRYHPLCACQAVPAFTMDEPFIGVAEQLYDDWLRETRGYGGKNAVNAFRRWWESEGRSRYTAPTI
ncbi:hypothetical protein [Streptomyces sp. NPDC047315]|uniref:VG15 protein n=1 Tax=Streptomyces sp. NPDC047315 TaxID=3155142 RepID=UPI0033F9A4D6